MTKYIFPLLLIFCFSCQSNQTEIEDQTVLKDDFGLEDHISIEVYPYEQEGATKASAMPKPKLDSSLLGLEKRFEYLLMNVSEIHHPEQFDRRMEIWNLYPDSLELKRLYLSEFVQDEKLVKYYEESIAPIQNSSIERSRTYSTNELMDVASKFFYCDKVEADSSIGAHICLGLNGVGEANWENDYTLLEAFCFEGIFYALDKEGSQIWDSFVSKIDHSSEQLKENITTLDHYLEEVKIDVFGRMRNDIELKQELMKYYELNESNLAFKLID
jgi:hypothetical protein